MNVWSKLQLDSNNISNLHEEKRAVSEQSVAASTMQQVYRNLVAAQAEVTKDDCF